MIGIFFYAYHTLIIRWRRWVLIVFCYSMIVAFLSSVLWTSESLKYQTRDLLTESPDLVAQKLAGGRLVPLPMAWLDSLRSIRGIKSIYPRNWGYYYDSPTGAVFTVMSSSLNVFKQSTKDIIHLDSNDVWLGDGVSKLKRIYKGDRLVIFDSNRELIGLVIKGVFKPENNLITQDIILMNEVMTKKILGLLPQQSTDLAVEVANSSEIDNVARKIEEKFPNLRVVKKAQILATYMSLFELRGGLFFYGLLFSLFAFFILVLEQSANISTTEKEEISILKSCGWQIDEIVKLKIFQSLSISIFSIFLGYIIGIIHVFLMDAFLIKTFFIGWSVLYPSFHLNVHISWNSLVNMTLLLTLPYMFSTIVPTWRISVEEVSDLMR
jgi:ABC-type lipoprotein release transport system permease subunit